MVERFSPLPDDGTECVVLDVPYNVAQRQTGARERDFVHLAPRVEMICRDQAAWVGDCLNPAILLDR